jgi:septal ring-binding cell division protein DamX
MKTKIILASLAILGSIELSAYTYEVNPLIGKNFTESNSLVDDSTAYGIRLNRYISEDNAIMFGYTRINDADYKRRKADAKAGRSTNGTCTTNGTCAPKPSTCNTPAPSTCNTPATSTCNTSFSGTNSNTNTGSASNSNTNTGSASNSNTNTGSASNNGANTGSASDNGTNPGTVIPTPGVGISNLSNTYSGDTDIDRFYINGLHNIHTQYSKLTPYVYGGFGYENVSNELKDNDSQGFFNAGGGLKYNLTDKFNILADVQGIKKFNNHDLDILGSIGLGFFFGNAFQPAPEAVVASGLEEVTPAAPVRKVTVVQVKPQPVVVAEVAKIVTDDKVEAAPTGEYYIQMAAGFKTDMETGCKHTRDLRDAGIDYDIKYTTIRGKNAAIVVVGPYDTKEEAKSHLKELRKYSKDAFVKRIKN